MAIHFEWYENPVPPNQPDEKKLHARITYNGNQRIIECSERF